MREGLALHVVRAQAAAAARCAQGQGRAGHNLPNREGCAGGSCLLSVRLASVFPSSPGRCIEWVHSPARRQHLSAVGCMRRCVEGTSACKEMAIFLGMLAL